MPEAKAAAKTPAKTGAKADNKEATEKKASNRTNFSKLYPEDMPLKVAVEENPKKKGSKAAERFEYYFKSETVGDFLAQGGTYQDIAYDAPRGFITLG